MGQKGMAAEEKPFIVLNEIGVILCFTIATNACYA